MTQFGKRVLGDKAHAAAVRSEKGGAAVFGVRVRGAIPESGPTNIAKRMTEHGPRVTIGASMQDTKGNEVDAVSLEDLKNILAENPTTFDSLYEVELAREGGARPEALDIFLQVETGIKGAMRADIIDDIRALQRSKAPLSARQADDANLRLLQAERQAARQEQNDKLKDASTIKALAERADNLRKIKESGDEVESASVDQQLTDLANEHGIDRQQGGSASERQPTEPSKPEGNVKPETQSTGPRTNVPKGKGKK